MNRRISTGFLIIAVLVTTLVVCLSSLSRRLGVIESNLVRSSRLNLLALDMHETVQRFETLLTTESVNDRTQARELQESFARDLEQMKGLVLSGEALKHYNQLSLLWNQFLGTFLPERTSSPAPPDESRAYLEKMNIQVGGLMHASLAWEEIFIQEELTSFRRMQRLAGFVAVLLLLANLLLWFISDRSRSVQQATRISNSESLSMQPEIAKDKPAEIKQTTDSLFRHLNHELKRPLASLQQSIYLLLEELQGPLTSEQRRILEIQLRCAKSVSNSIGDWVDLYQIEAGVAEYRLESQDLVPIIRDLVEGYEAQSRERRIGIEVDLPETPLIVECDRERIGRAIGYVIENALKFSRPGSAIKIKAEYVPKVSLLSPTIPMADVSQFAQDKGFVVLAIADRGPGIPESQREAIFQKFYQIKKDDESYQQGMGIGLTLCRNILFAHHGAVWVENNPAGGALFSILLPMANTKAYRAGGSS